MTNRDETRTDTPRLTDRARRKVVLLLSGATLLLLVGAYLLRAVVGPVLLAMCFAYVLEPLVQTGRHRLRLSRAFSVFMIFFLFMGLTGVAVWYLVQQGIALGNVMLGEAGVLTDLPAKASAFVQTNLPSQKKLIEWLNSLETPDVFAHAISATQSALDAVGDFFGTVFTWMSVVVLFPIYLYYFMLDLPKIWVWIKKRLPGRHRRRILQVTGKIHEGLSAFLRGRVVIAIIKGFLTAFGLMLFDLPYSFVVGMIAGLLSIFPFVGAALGLLTSVILVLVVNLGLGSLIGVVVVFVVVEGIEGYALYPLILSDKLDMHPVTMIVSVLAWGTLFGLFGVFVAIPLTIIVRAVAQEFLLRPLETLAEEE